MTLGPQVGVFKKARTVKVDDAIRIESGGQPLLVGARLVIKEPVSPRTSVRVAPPPRPPEPKPPVVSPPQPVVTPPPAGLMVDFGTVSNWSGPLPTREIRLTNNQAQVMDGTVRSTLRWLEVTPTSFSCPPGQEVALTARLTAAASRLRPKTYDVADALVIESGGKKHLVNARLVVARVSPGKPVSPPTAPPRKEKKPPLAAGPPAPPAGLAVDFGMVLDWSGPLPTQEIRLTNSRSQEMDGTVRSTLRWLEVTPTSFSCPPGQEVALTARLTKAASRLRPKTYEVTDALVIESGGKEHLVSARLVVASVSPRGRVSPPTTPPRKKKKKPVAAGPPDPLAGLTVDFGTVSDWSGPLPTQEIRLTNSRSQEMDGTVRSTLPWLDVTPTSFSCPPSQEVVLTVKLTKAGSRLRPKTYEVTDALVIESGGKKHLVNTRLVVARVSPGKPVSPPTPPPKKKKKPPVVAAPSDPLAGLTVDFGTVSDWSGPLPTQEIRLTNSRSQAMDGTVRSTLPWLDVTPTSFSCPPGQEMVLTANLTKAASRLRPKAYEVADALVIESSGKKHPVKARLEVAIAMGYRRGGMRTIVPPKKGKRAKAGEPAQPAPAQKPESAQAAKSRRPSKTLPEALVVEPTLIDWGTVSDWRDPLPTREIELSNGLKKDWSGTVRSTVPWLEVTPTEVTCPTGATVILQARLTEHGARLRPGRHSTKRYSASDALVIEGDGQKLRVEAHLTVSRA